MLPPNLTINTDEFHFLPWAERIKRLNEGFGFQTLEVGFTTVPDTDTFNTVKSSLEEYGVPCVCGHDWYPFLTPNEPDEIKQMQDRFVRDLDWSKQLGADKLIFYTGENEQVQGEEAVDVLVERLQPVIREAASMGMTILLETEFSAHGTDPGTSVALLKSMMQKADTPTFGINFDAANLYIAGEECYPYGYHELKPWIKHVHIKDVAVYRDSLHNRGEGLEAYHTFTQNGRTCTCVPIGAGAVNLYSLLQQLKADAYDGIITLEAHVPADMTEDAVTRGIRFVQEHYLG